MKGILYDFYSEDLSEKVKTSLSVRRTGGKYLAPFAPHGYWKSENDIHKIEVDEEAAHIVKRIYNEYICGSSMYQIAQKLDEEHVITSAEYISRKGYHDTFNYVWKTITWTSATVSQILRNEMTHSNAGRPKYECGQHYVNPSITCCVKSVRDEDIEEIIMQELQVQLDVILDTEKVQKSRKQMKIMSEYEEKVLIMLAGFDIIESRTKVVELNREIVENFVDRIVVHEGGEIEIRWKFMYKKRGLMND